MSSIQFDLGGASSVPRNGRQMAIIELGVSTLNSGLQILLKPEKGHLKFLFLIMTQIETELCQKVTLRKTVGHVANCVLAQIALLEQRI